ncbi:MAG: hypothetical protein AAFN79_17385 [Pseudomonadota bacterium]
MDIAHIATQSKDTAALYDAAHRMRHEALRSGMKAVFGLLRDLVAFASGRTAH